MKKNEYGKARAISLLRHTEQMLTVSILSNNRVKQKPEFCCEYRKPRVSLCRCRVAPCRRGAPSSPSSAYVTFHACHSSPPGCTDPCLFHGKEKERRSTREYFMRLQSAHQANDLKVMEAQNVILFFVIGHSHCQYQCWQGKEL